MRTSQKQKNKIVEISLQAAERFPRFQFSLFRYNMSLAESVDM